jgi:DNA-binding NarL/FixJ family response regulator
MELVGEALDGRRNRHPKDPRPLAGHRRIPRVAERILSSSKQGEAKYTKITPMLTKREVEVLKAIAQGENSKEIAETLHVSERTVRNHLANIYRKLGVHDRTQAVLYAVRHGLVDPRGVDDS